jgi:hypothetical protein
VINVVALTLGAIGLAFAERGLARPADAASTQRQ